MVALPFSTIKLTLLPEPRLGTKDPPVSGSAHLCRQHDRVRIYVDLRAKLPPELRDRLVLAARRANVTPSALVRAVLSTNLPELLIPVGGDPRGAASTQSMQQMCCAPMYCASIEPIVVLDAVRRHLYRLGVPSSWFTPISRVSRHYRRP